MEHWTNTIRDEIKNQLISIMGKLLEALGTILESESAKDMIESVVSSVINADMKRKDDLIVKWSPELRLL